MKKKLFVHIGMPKAGSTALQEFLFMNREVLEDLGLLYPDPRQLEQFSRNPQTMKGHHIVPMYLTGFFWAHFPKKAGITPDQIFTFIRNQISASPARRILLSSEAIWFMLNRKDVVNEFISAFSEFEPTVIVYLRRIDDHIRSGYNECVKSSGYTMTVDEFISDRFLDPSNNYYSQLTLWTDEVEKRNVRVRLYDKNTFYDGSIFKDLLSLCDTGWDSKLRLPDKDANPRLSLNALMFQRYINLLVPEIEIRKKFSDALLTYSSEDDNATERAFAEQNLLNHAQKELIFNRYRIENQKVASSFLNKEEQSIFLDEKNISTISYPGLALTEAIRIIEYLESGFPDCAGFLNGKIMASAKHYADPDQPENILLKAMNSYLSGLKKL